MIHESLAYTAFRATGVPAPRTGYAYVRVNGDDYGLHLNVETLDSVSLPTLRPFDADTQHLYEGEGGDRRLARLGRRLRGRRGRRARTAPTSRR